MYRSELPYFILFAIIILITPFLPSAILLSLDLLIIRIAVVLLLLYLIRVGPTAGLFGLFAIGILYLERNRRKALLAKSKLNMVDINTPPQMTVKEQSIPQKTVPVLPFSSPLSDDELPFIPSDDTGSDNFEPVGESINMKDILHTSYPSSGYNPGAGASNELEDLYENNGFGHLPGVETLG
jgi:hypothetical protein